MMVKGVRGALKGCDGIRARSMSMVASVFSVKRGQVEEAQCGCALLLQGPREREREGRERDEGKRRVDSNRWRRTFVLFSVCVSPSLVFQLMK